MIFSKFVPSFRSAMLAAACAVVVLSGCHTPKNPDAMNTHWGIKGKKTPKKMAENVHRTEIPSHLRRVAVLPFYRGSFDHIDFSLIERNFLLELGKRNLFEIVEISEEEMKSLFFQEEFSSVENLPSELITKLHHIYAIDGILLTDVSYYRAYKPVGLGVRQKLLDGRSGELVWAVDEVFDSSNPSVENAAKSFYLSESLIQYPLNATNTVIHSPTRFAKYVAYSIFDTISLQKD